MIRDPDLKLAYTVDEAVEVLPWSKAKVYELMADGTLPWRKQFGRRYILREDLQAAVAAGRALGAPQKPECDSHREPLPLSGVYLLMLGSRAAYIGRSSHLAARLATHRRSGRAFDTVSIIPCAPQLAIWLEAELVRALRPAQNRIRFNRRAGLVGRSLEAAGL